MTYIKTHELTCTSSTDGNCLQYSMNVNEDFLIYQQQKNFNILIWFFSFAFITFLFWKVLFGILNRVRKFVMGHRS